MNEDTLIYKEMIGEELSTVLSEIEETLWDYEANSGAQPEYTLLGLRAATKIFMSVLMDKLWNLQENENMPMEERIKMVTKAGQDIHDLVKTYTDIDTFDLYK